MSHPLAFFHHLQLGDWLQKSPEIDVDHEVAIMRATSGANLKSLAFNGANAHSEYPITVTMKRGAGGSESRTQFKTRVRQFSEAVVGILPLFEGPVSIVRDPLGTICGERDASTIDTISPSGGEYLVTTADQTEWNTGNSVLVIDGTSFEIAEVTNVAVIGPNRTYTIGLNAAFPAGALIYRLEFYIPEAHVGARVRFPVPDVARSGEVVADITFTFRTITTTVSGQLV